MEKTLKVLNKLSFLAQAIDKGKASTIGYVIPLEIAIEIINNISKTETMKNLELTFLRNKNPFKIGDKIIVKALQYGFRGGFDSNSHGGQWTTEGNIEPCVIVEYQKTELTKEKNNVGYIQTFDLCDIELVNLDCL